MKTTIASIAAATLLAAAAPAGAQDAPAVRDVSRTVQVGAGGATTVRLACPPRALSLAGAATRLGPGTALRDSVPSADGRGWLLRFVALEGTPRRSATALARCVRLRLPVGVRSVRLVAGTVSSGRLTLRGLSSRRVSLRCDRGSQPTGWGLDRGPQGASSGLPSGELRVAAAVPGTGGLRFRLENTGGGTASGTLRARCIERTQTGRRRSSRVRHAFAFRRAAFSDRVARGSARALRHGCRRGEASLMPGHALDWRDDILLSGEHPAGPRAGRWTFNHASGGPVGVRTFLPCLSLRTRFR